MFDEDLQQLLRAILLVVGAILPIVNPVGSAPMFLAMTHDSDSKTRSTLAGLIAVNSFVLLLGSLIFGNFVLRLFGLSVPVTIGANHASSITRILIAILGAIIGVAVISGTVWLTYRYAERVALWLGHVRLIVVLRLSAFIVLCIGVQIAWNGIKGLVEEFPFAASTAAAPAVAPKR